MNKIKKAPRRISAVIAITLVISLIAGISSFAAFNKTSESGLWNNGTCKIHVSDGTNTNIYVLRATWDYSSYTTSTFDDASRKINLYLTKIDGSGQVTLSLGSSSIYSQKGSDLYYPSGNANNYRFMTVPLKITCPANYEYYSYSNDDNNVLGQDIHFYSEQPSSTSHTALGTARPYRDKTTTVYFSCHMCVMTLCSNQGYKYQDFNAYLNFGKAKATTTYHGNGGTYNSSSTRTVSHIIGESYDSGSGWSRSGYTLKGWSTSQSGSSVNYSLGATIQGPYCDTYATNNRAAGYTTNETPNDLYAVWEETDTQAPTTSLSSTENRASSQTVTLTASDNKGVTKYYWGTSSSPSDSSYTSVTSTTSYSTTKTVSSSGTYYFFAKDAKGNTSTSKSITFYQTTFSVTNGSLSPSTVTKVITPSGSSFVTPSFSAYTGYTAPSAWSKSSGGTVNKNTSYTPTANVSMTAYCSEIYASIYYNGPGVTLSNLSLPSTGTLWYEDAYYLSSATAPSGYTFYGWATTAARAQAGTRDYTPTGLYKSSYTIPSTSYVYAVVTSTLTYNRNGHGGTAPTSVTMNYKDEATAPGMSNDGQYIFKGWSTSSTATTPSILAGGTVKNANAWRANTTLYAVWEEQTYTARVKYHANGGTITSGSYGVDPNSIVTSGGNIVHTDVTTTDTYKDLKNVYSDFKITKTGYHTEAASAWRNTSDVTSGTKYFNEDQTSAGGTNPVTTLTLNGGQTDISFNKDFTLYANWLINTYSVRFHSNGGSGSMSNQTFEYDETKKLTNNSFSAPSGDGGHWEFIGWATSEAAAANGTVTYSADQNYTNLYSDIANTTGGYVDVYAVWRRQVNFKSGVAGATTKNTVQYYGKSGSQSSYQAQPVTVPSGTADVSGWTLDGWRADKTAAAKTYNATGTITPTATSAATSNEYYTLYGVYTRSIYLHYDPGTSSATGSTPDSTPQTQYYNSGGDSVSSATFTLANNGFTFSVYTFDCWDLGTDGTGAEGTSYTWTPARNETSPKTIVAQWNVPSYTVTFHPGEGTFSKTTVTVTYESGNNNQPGPATREGYVFKGWYTLSTGGDRVFDDDGKYVEGDYWTDDGKWHYPGDVNVYARWEEAKGYRVMFVVGKSSNSNPSTEATTAGDTDIGTPANIKGEGYQYELFQGIVPDGVSGTEKALKPGYKYHTRSLAFQSGGAVAGYHFIGLQGGLTY